MNKSFVVLVAIAVMLGLYSCNDETIGSSIGDTVSTVIEDSTFSITGQSVWNSHVYGKAISQTDSTVGSAAPLQLVGKIKSNGYGRLTSDVVTQFMPTEKIDTMGVPIEWLDSCRLALRIPRGGFTGDSLVPMRISVYRLNKQIPHPIYTDFNPSGYYSKSDLLGTASYSASVLEQGDTALNKRSYIVCYVPLPVSFAKEVYTKFKTNPEIFKDPTAFSEFFPGLYITTTYGNGRVMNFYDAEIETWYKKQVEDGDSIIVQSPVQQTIMAATPEIVSNNNINLQPDQSVKNMVSGGDAIIMGPAGYEMKVNFPIQDIIDQYKARVGNNIAVLNTLSLTIPVEEIENEYGVQPPKYLLMVKASKRDDFIANDSITNNKDSFYATYDSSKHRYVFSGMRNYMINILNNQKGIATEDDKEFIIMPVDLQFYSSSTGYSYYYPSSTTTVITGIGPGVSSPSLAKLLLPKSKISISYTRQSF